MRTTLQLLLLIILATLPIAAFADQDFRAVLSGKNEAPQVKTPATGDLRMTLSGNRLTYTLTVDGITSPSAANIHRGRRGQNGPPVAGLFGGPTKTGPFSGILANGTITEKSLIGDLQGKTVADLVRLIASGNAYVTVVTETYPAGEIRGQIEKE